MEKLFVQSVKVCIEMSKGSKWGRRTILKILLLGCKGRGDEAKREIKSWLFGWIHNMFRLISTFIAKEISRVRVP